MFAAIGKVINALAATPAKILSLPAHVLSFSALAATTAPVLGVTSNIGGLTSTIGKISLNTSVDALREGGKVASHAISLSDEAFSGAASAVARTATLTARAPVNAVPQVQGFVDGHPSAGGAGVSSQIMQDGAQNVAVASNLATALANQRSQAAAVVSNSSS